MKVTNILGLRPEEQLLTLEDLTNLHRLDARRITVDDFGPIKLETSDLFSLYKGTYPWTGPTYWVEVDGSFTVDGADEPTREILEGMFDLLTDSDTFGRRA